MLETLEGHFSNFAIIQLKIFIIIIHMNEQKKNGYFHNLLTIKVHIEHYRNNLKFIVGKFKQNKTNITVDRNDFFLCQLWCILHKFDNNKSILIKVSRLQKCPQNFSQKFIKACSASGRAQPIEPKAALHRS